VCFHICLYKIILGSLTDTFGSCKHLIKLFKTPALIILFDIYLLCFANSDKDLHPYYLTIGSKSPIQFHINLIFY